MTSLPTVGRAAATLALLAAGVAMAQQEDRSLVIAIDVGTPSGRVDAAAAARQYWLDTDAAAVRRSRLDGSDEEQVARTLGLPYGIAYDRRRQVLVWTSSDAGVVQAQGLRDAAARVLASGFEAPGFAVTQPIVGGQYVYSLDGGQLVQATVAASGEPVAQRVIAAVPGAEAVHGLAIDAGTGVAYLGDADGRMARAIDLASGEMLALDYLAQPPVRPPADDDPPPDDEPRPRGRTGGQP